MNSKLRDGIVDDLLKKRPTGPDGTYLEYTTSREYDYDKGRYVDVLVPSVAHYGYDPEVLFSLEIRSQNACNLYVRRRWFSGKSDWELGRRKATITRRANRLWNRISQAIHEVRKAGPRGVYKVFGRRPHSTYGYVYALSKEEAAETANMSFGYLVPKRPGYDTRLEVQLVNISTSDSLSKYNANIVDDINRQIAAREQDIKETQAKIENLKARLTTISLVEAQLLELGDE